MASHTIIYEKDGPVGIIRLNRPQRMNAVNESMYREIQKVLSLASTDGKTRVLVVTGSIYEKDGNQKQAFCAGADLREHATGRRSRSGKKRYIKLAHQTTRMLYEFPKPTIAAINGPARGAGAELALNCDFLIMADSASIAFTETGLGTMVGGGVTHHLPRLIGLARAKELIYTGTIVSGGEAVRIGLAHRSCGIEELNTLALKLAEDLAAKAPLSLKLAKKMLQQGNLLELKTILNTETHAILACMETADWHEGIQSFMEKRKPNFTGR